MEMLSLDFLHSTGIVKMAIFKEVYDKEVENKLIPPYAYQAKKYACL